MSKRKADTKILRYDPSQRTWIYEMFDHIRNICFYVGRTVDTIRRGGEHDRKGSSLIRNYVKHHNVRVRDCVRVVAELPDGVPSSRAGEFEAFFIMQRDTIYHAVRCPDGCNQNNGAHVANLDYHAIEAEVAAGIEWPEVSEAVAKARGNEAVLEQLVQDFGDIEPELHDALRDARMVRVDAERAELGVQEALDVARREVANYEAMVPHVLVQRGDVEASLNAVKDAAPENDALAKQIKWIRTGVKPDHFPDQPVPAAFAKYMLLAVVEWLGAKAEATIRVNDVVMRGLRAAREWSAANEGKKPMDKGKTAEERTHGKFLADWKGSGKNQYNRRHEAHARVLFRHYPSVLAFFDLDNKARSADREARVRDALAAGYTWLTEPFEGPKLPKSGTGPFGEWKHLYNKVQDLLRGAFDEAAVLRMVGDLPPERRGWYVAQHAANRPNWLKTQKESQAKEQAQQRANGVPEHPTKKSKYDAPAEAGPSVEDGESDDESDDDESDGSDEEIGA
jgi:hypothetical protein